MKQQEADVLGLPIQTAPAGVDLRTMLGVVPNWRLFDIATCFGLWRTDGMSKYELVAALAEHVMVTPSALWSVMTQNERNAASKLAPTAMIEAKSPSSLAIVQAKPYQFPRTILELIDNTVFGGRFRRSHSSKVEESAHETPSQPATRPLLSVLVLLEATRVVELAESFGLTESQPLEVAVTLERKNVHLGDVLRRLTTDELRLVAAAWTLMSSRENLLTRLEGALQCSAVRAADMFAH